MTTGLLGGAFDPPHAGHVVLAREAVERFGLDRLLVLVVAAPAHKPVATPVEDRLELARAAFADVPLAEARRDDHAYTVDSLRAGAFDPATTVFLVGADEFAAFPTWKEPDAILDLARLGVATRPGYPAKRLLPVLSALGRPSASSSSRSRRSTSPRRRSALVSPSASPSKTCFPPPSPGGSSSAVSTMRAVDRPRRVELR